MLLPRSRRLRLVLLIAVFWVFYYYLTRNDGAVYVDRPEDTPTVPNTVASVVRNVKQSKPQSQAAPSELAKHKYRKDGLLEANEDGPHPIYELIARAEKAWDDKLKRASKTLKEATKEYRSRYNRDPPAGFDVWWKYVQDHDVQLPDEYDTIFHDIEPFWGIDPEDLAKIQKELETKVDSYTLGKNESSPLGVVTYAFHEGKYDDLIKGSVKILELLREVEADLPPFRATFSPHDGPNRLSDYGVKSAVLEAAAGGTAVLVHSLPKINPIGWIAACPPSSPARQKPPNLENPPPRPAKKTFIHDHKRTMDPCVHPGHFHHHGQFLSHYNGPTPQQIMVPEFSYCSTTIHHNIRVSVPYGWVEDIFPRSNDPEWEDRLDERLLWRGSNTGIFHAEHTPWQGSHRDFLVSFTNELNGTSRILPPALSPKDKTGKPKEIRNAYLNPATMDIAFAGNPILCTSPTCELLAAIYPWREKQSIREAGNYKYVLDIDGNGWSGRFKRLITSNALIFKVTVYPEWYMDRIAPWVHYVPVQIDLSDLHDTLLFFRGDGNGDGAHQNMAKKIAMAGRQWSQKFWRKEDMVAYLFRLMLEYVRVMSPDRESMSYRERHRT